MRVDYRALTLVLLAVAACESEDEERPAPAGPIPIEELRAEAVGARCDFLARCGLQPDAMTCRRVDFASTELLQLIVDATRGQLVYNEFAGRAWVDAVRAQRCSAHNASAERRIDEAWEQVFAGPVPMGSGCWVDGECEGTGVCDKSACEDSWECCSGACAPPPPVLAFGDACDGSVPCEGGAYCSGDGICSPRADVGEPCNDSDGCGDDQGCDGNTGTCYLLALPDEACDPTFDSPCRDYDRFCSAEGKCVRLPGDGQPCDPEGPGCLGYAMCVDGTCRRRALEGEPCDVVECLGDLECYDGICGRPVILTCG